MECLGCKYIRDIGEPSFCLAHRNQISKVRAYVRNQVKKWRNLNPEKAKELSRKHQLTWRTKNPELNRERAREGMRKLKEKTNENRN